MIDYLHLGDVERPIVQNEPCNDQFQSCDTHYTQSEVEKENVLNKTV